MGGKLTILRLVHQAFGPHLSFEVFLLPASHVARRNIIRRGKLSKFSGIGAALFSTVCVPDYCVTYTDRRVHTRSGHAAKFLFHNNSIHANSDVKPEQNHPLPCNPPACPEIHTYTPMCTSQCWCAAIKLYHFPAFLGCHIMCEGSFTTATASTATHPVQPNRFFLPPIPPAAISHCVLMATLPSRIMTSQALLPCRLCLTQFLQQPPCVSGKMDSVRQQWWFMGNSCTSEEVRCGRMNLWQIGEGEKKGKLRGRERDRDWNTYEKEQ